MLLSIRCLGIYNKLLAIWVYTLLFCSHFVSAKTNNMINACFLKIAAEVVGVKLTATDIQRVTVSTTLRIIIIFCVCVP